MGRVDIWSLGELTLGCMVSFMLLASFTVLPPMFLPTDSFLYIDLLRHVTYSLKEKGGSDDALDRL